MILPNYNEKMQEEKYLINESIIHLLTVPIKISTGLSTMHNFLPTVKLTYVAPCSKDSISISFMDIDWHEIFEHMLNMSPLVNSDGTLSENEMIFQQFKLTSIPCEGQPLLKLEKYNNILYFCKEWLQEIKLYSHVISYKIKLLKDIDFSSHYTSILLFITEYDNDVVYSERIKNVCSLQLTVQNYCMLEYLAFNYHQILCDITKVLYVK